MKGSRFRDPFRMKRFLVFLVLAGVVCVGLLLATGDWGTHLGGSSITPRSGGEYHAPLINDPPTLDPAMSTDSTSSWSIMQMFDGLVRQQSGTELSVAPCIATSWEISTDQKTYRFTLREDVHFHAFREWDRSAPGGRAMATKNGGRLVEAEDFRYSFERVLRRETQSPRTVLFEPIEGATDFMSGKSAHVHGISCPKKNVLEIHLERPFAPFLATMTMPGAFVVPREDAVDLKEEFARHPVGSGAFCFEHYRPGKELSMVANANYFLGAPYLKKLTFHVVPDEEKRFEMFEDSFLHHSTVPDPKYDKVRERESKYYPYLTEVSELGVYYYGMNTQKPPFDKPEVRRAISHAVDREAIRKYIKSERVDTALSPLPPSLRRWGFTDPASMPITFDLVRAGALLDQAGYPLDPNTGLRVGFPRVPLDVPQGEEHRRVALAVQANLADLGIESTIAVRSWKDHLMMVRKGDSAMFRMGWAADYKDPDNFLYYNFHSRNIGKSNQSRYANPKVDQLLDDARAKAGPDRLQLYREAEDIIVRDAAWICLYYFKTAIVRQPNVRGIDLTEFGEQQIRFDEVWLDRKDS